MSNVYLALNGDDVGGRIGDAIANDDHEGLAAASSAIDGAHGNIDQWAESVGGKKVTGSGDEAIYIVPEEALSDLDSIRGKYKEESGHGLTVGVGQSMSQASKALIYGKLNGKDQVVHYEPMIEDYLAQEDAGENGDDEMVPAPEEVQGQADADAEQEAGIEDQDQSPEGEEQPQEQGEEPAPEDDGQEMPPKKVKPEMPNAEQDEDQDPDSDVMEPQATEDSDEDGTMEVVTPDNGDEPEIGTEDDISADNEEALDSPAPPVQNKTKAQKGAIDGKTDKDFGTSEQDLAEDDENPSEEVEDSPEQGEDEDLPDDGQEPVDGDSEMPAPTDSKVKGQSVYQDINQDDEQNPDEVTDGTQPSMDDADSAPAEEDGDQDQDDGEDPLASMIHGDMQEGDEEQAPEGEEQPEGENGSLDDELKSDIASALMAFKENKDMLEQAREQNPKLYHATLTMLTSMIAMAKKLGYGPEQDMQDQENGQELEEGFPAADEGGEEQEEQPEEQEEQLPPKQAAPPQGQPPAKKQVGRLRPVQKTQ